MSRSTQNTWSGNTLLQNTQKGKKMTSSNHTIRNNGAPYAQDGTLANDDPKLTSGVGRAGCSCGVWSDEELKNKAQRVAWFKDHKAQAESGDEDLIGDVPAQPTKGKGTKSAKTTKSAQAKPSSGDGDAPKRSNAKGNAVEATGDPVEIKSTVLPNLFKFLVAEGSVELATQLGLAAKPYGRSLTLTVWAPKAAHKAVSDGYTFIWDEAAKAFTEYRKTDDFKNSPLSGYNTAGKFLKDFTSGVALATQGKSNRGLSAGAKAGHETGQDAHVTKLVQAIS
jgi:hypothetical protein